jgi:hypothetical protein
MESGAETSQATDRPGTPEVAVGKTVPTATPQNLAAKKLIVAVHGVGDQSSYATLQSVVDQFCRFHGEPSGVSLGAFHNGQSTFSVSSDDRRKLESLAFAEVYWAPIPRKVVEDKHTLEEAKRWATTIIERLRMRARKTHAPCRDQDFELSTQILHEMIETIAVADRLCYLADRAGVFTFDLRAVLDDYLGDVQIVTEFKEQRKKILEAFRDVMTKAQAQCPNAEIYIIAHSEGTVVSFLGLLEGFRDPEQKVWADRVRGLMTLGSPIDKHLFFWPELFGTAPPVHAPEQPIAWWNYYDYGDPIGFELDAARDWMKRPVNNGGPAWRNVFEFEKRHDCGFTRYPFPGKAHVDYWKDSDVFAHFIGTVIDQPAQGQKRTHAAPPQPRTNVLSWIASWILPYLGVFAILFVAAFVLTKAFLGATGDGNAGSIEILRYATSGALLLFAIIIAARVPRLTRLARLWVIAGLIALAFGAGFLVTVPEIKGSPRFFAGMPPGTTRLFAALFVVVVSSVIGAIRPQWGAKPMIMLGGFALTGLVLNAVMNNRGGPVWPLFPAGAAFLYLWWLAALLFDLVVVWHMYIRSSFINTRIRDMAWSSNGPNGGKA